MCTPPAVMSLSAAVGTAYCSGSGVRRPPTSFSSTNPSYRLPGSSLICPPAIAGVGVAEMPSRMCKVVVKRSDLDQPL
ncbi:hypothetical protein OG474_23145 [Kribbella sp. NBC_01505]|uniref:hypothetical protein n=1 Tax=Kribbella sp. NBC_01505 TaxID=2903580 RepID=UPI00386DB4D1